jgi:O-antigen/teichoic acid export membrane protein
MTTHDWRHYFWRNTVTNYARTILRLLSGVVLFRLTFQHLPQEAFGFYSLLWSLFGYTILLDFGLGFTAQKAVAQMTADNRIDHLNHLICTIFWTFAFLGAVMLAGFSVVQPWFLDWVKVSAANRAAFGLSYKIFVCAMALAFPIGIFPEMLRGLQRIDLANSVTIVALLVNLGLLTWGLLAGWSLPVIVFISVATTVAPNFAALVMVFRRIHGLSLHPRHFRFRAIQGVLSFSIVAYLITFTNLIMSRTDQAVISFSIGVGFIALYQAGYKASEMFGLFSVQMQEAISPAAARMNATKDEDGLRDLLVKSSRLTLLLTAPLYGLCAVYLEPLIKILTGLKTLDPSTWWVGQSLLLATFSSLLTSSCSKRILMMCGWERSLLKASLVDAGINLVASLVLVFKFGVLGVALGTMIPTIFVGWLWIVPMTARFLKQGVAGMLLSFTEGVRLPVASALAVLAALRWLAPLPASAGFGGCIWRGALVMAVLAVTGRPFLKSIRKGAA